MALCLYDTLSRKKREFGPADGKTVKWYTCGITSYNYAHIGNFRTYVCQDVMRRYFKYKGWKVKQVQNFTDVDDKTIKGAKEEGIPLKEFTTKYERVFFEDIEKLNIEKVEFYPRATDHVPEMVELIKKLLAKGVAYKSQDGSVYYNVRKFAGYGKLSHTKLAGLREGARVKQDSYDKQQASDFALWKAWDKEDGDVFWETEIGKKGRPGWHLECSAMALKYLGEKLDAHAGGVDLIFPHHENEIAQSEAATGKQFARHWLHCEHLLVGGRKMSKSLGNFYTLRDVLAKGYSPLGVRWLLLGAHYRQQLNFTFDGLKAAKETLAKLADFVERIKQAKKLGEASVGLKELVEKIEADFEKAMDDDLNTPNAIAAVFELVLEANKLLREEKMSKKDAQLVLAALKKFDKVFGVLEMAGEKKIPAELGKFVEQKISERDEARGKKDFRKADEIRRELAEKRILLEDTPKGTKYKLV